MRCLRPPSLKPLLFLAAGMVVSGALALAADAPPAGKKAARGLEVLVTADAIASPEGFRPKPDKPVHYIFNQTRQSLGDAVAGIKLPDPALVEDVVVKELAKQGFVRTAVGGPVPEIYIVAIVGDSNFEEPPIDLDYPLDDPNFRPYMNMVDFRALMERNLLSNQVEIALGLEGLWDRNKPDSADRTRAKDLVIAEAKRIRDRLGPRMKDRPKIQSLVGATKVMRGLEQRAISNSEAERIAWAAAENRFYLSLNAFDAERWRKRERVLLWRTTMLIDWRKNFGAELPTMLAHAGPVFGTDMAVPGFFDERTRARAEVEIGELKVVPDQKAASATDAPK